VSHLLGPRHITPKPESETASMKLRKYETRLDDKSRRVWNSTSRLYGSVSDAQSCCVVDVQPMGPLQNPPDDYMCYSIFVTLCCCWLIGIFAILRSSECRAAIAAGDRVTAEVRSREARSRAHLALGLGLGSIIFSFIFVGVYIGIIVNSY